jgi:hypothetical protein
MVVYAIVSIAKVCKDQGKNRSAGKKVKQKC